MENEEHNVPLLAPRQAASASASAGAENGEYTVIRGGHAGGEAGLGQRLLEENRKLWKVAGPAICTRFSGFGVTVISQAFIGHIGPTELAAYALVSTVLMRFGNGILLGMASALETLCGQSYGAKQYHMMGIHLQRSWIILSSCAVVMLPIFLFTEPLLVFIGQDPKISAVAGVISVWYIPIMFANVCSFTLQMYLVDSCVWAAHVCVLRCMPSHMDGVLLPGTHRPLPRRQALFILWCDALVRTSLSFEYIYAVPEIKKEVVRIYLPNLETWYSTILVLLTGYMKNPEVTLDALSICLNINGWEMMISIGLLSATGVRVANELGAGSARRAKFAILNVVTTSFSIGLVFFVFFLLFRGKLSYIFTTSEEVAAAVADLSPLLAVSILLNSVQPVLSGVAVGSGWQSVVAYVNITTYYLIGIPLGAILGYVLGYHVKGVWVGMLLGTLVQTIVLLFITIRTDWDKQVEVTRQRLNRWFIDGNREKAASSGSP